MSPQSENIIERAKRLATDAGLEIGSGQRFPFTYHHDDVRLRLGIDSRGEVGALLSRWAARSGSADSETTGQYQACLVAIQHLIKQQFGGQASSWLEDQTNSSRQGLALFVEEAEAHIAPLLRFDTFVQQKRAMRTDTIRESAEQFDNLLEAIGAAGGFCALCSRHGSVSYIVGLPHGSGWRTCDGKVLKAVVDYFDDDDIRYDFDVGQSDFADKAAALESVERRTNPPICEEIEFLVGGNRSEPRLPR